MKFENRQTQFPGRKRVRKLNSNNEQVEEYFVVMENAEGAANPEGTPVNSKNLEKANWRDDDSLSFAARGDNELPTSLSSGTQIVTTADGKTWLIPPGTSAPTELPGPRSSVVKIVNDIPEIIFDSQPQIQINYAKDTADTAAARAKTAVNTAGAALETANTKADRNEFLQHASDPLMHLSIQSMDTSFQSSPSDTKVPSTRLVSEALSQKANLIGGTMSDPIKIEEFNGTLLEFISYVSVGSTKESILSNGNAGGIGNAGKPFKEWPDEYGVLTKVSRYNEDITFIECRLGGEIVRHASRFIIRDLADNGWIRPTGWVKIWGDKYVSTGAKNGEYLHTSPEKRLAITPGTHLRVTSRLADKISSFEGVYLNGHNYIGYLVSNGRNSDLIWNVGIYVTPDGVQAFSDRKGNSSSWAALGHDTVMITCVEKEIYM